MENMPNSLDKRFTVLVAKHVKKPEMENMPNFLTQTMDLRYFWQNTQNAINGKHARQS